MSVQVGSTLLGVFHHLFHDEFGYLAVEEACYSVVMSFYFF